MQTGKGYLWYAPCLLTDEMRRQVKNMGVYPGSETCLSIPTSPQRVVESPTYSVQELLWCDGLWAYDYGYE